MAVRQPVLVMIQGPEPGSIYKLPDNRVTTIGRSSRNTIRAVSPSVSRFHCEVAFVNGRWELTDLNSRQGTMLNGEPVEGKAVLRAGDIIRLSTSVFRFDMIDETVQYDEAMLAIKEAELDQKLVVKGEGFSSMEDIIVRSRLEGETVRESRARHRQALKVNLVFVGVVAAAVGLLVTAVYFYGRRGGSPSLRSPAEREQEAAEALRVALALVTDAPREAVRSLDEVARAYPNTESGRKADARIEPVLWGLVEQELTRAPALEAERDYAAALAIYDDLADLSADPAVAGLVEERKGYTVRLATAAFRNLEKEAHRHVQQRQIEAAADLYRWAAKHIGVPQLVDKAEAELQELIGQPAR